MCGIAGIIDPRLAPETRESAVGRMCAAMLHRGPDDQGIASRVHATLGMRRLAIFDPANGHQPMVSPDGRFTLVFNGAIYNFRALRDELAGTHWTFRTNCDTEVLLAVYARWGADCLKRLRGMFAFAVWDDREQELFLARDPFGIKPLYYRQDGSRFLFGSELNALLASGLGDATLDPLAVADYLAWLAVPAPRTIYRGTMALQPGECAIFRRGTLEIRASWSFRAIPENPKPCRTLTQFIGELRERLDDTVRAHVVADVPVGAFLSGGLDSAAVVGLMSRANNTRLRTFSIDFAEPGYSEASAAESTARHFGTEHRTTSLTAAEVARDIEQLLHGMDQPTGDGINTYYASRAARQGGVTVALSGLGGDELFGGYPSFRDTPRIARWLPAWRAVPERARAALISRLQRGDTRRRKLADVLTHARNLNEVGAMQRRVFSEQSVDALLNPGARPSAAARRPFHPILDSLATDLDVGQTFDVVSAWELRTYMTDVLLRDSDTMSMRHSLELRVPLVDRPLIEWLWRQPAEFKSNSRRPKSALHDALKDILPPDMAQRKKWGFSLPMTVWMKRELRPFLDETFSDANIGRSGLFATPAVRQSWNHFLQSDDTREWSRLWSLAVMIAFANRRQPGPTPSSSQSTSTRRQNNFPTSSLDPVVPGPVVSSPAVPKAARHTLLLAPEIFSSEGGIPRILRTYLKALCDLAEPNVTARLLALNDRIIDAADITPHVKVRLESWSACGRNKVKFIRETLRLSRGCDQLICGHVFMLPVAWLARRFNPRLRYYLVAHGIEVWRRFTLAERLALRGAEKIFCVSDYTRRELLKNCPLPEGRAVVLPNALDPLFKIGPGRPLLECEPVILVVTRLTFADSYKGVEHMIKAMPAIRAEIPAARLRIVGRGDDVPRLQALVAKLSLGEFVEFTGYIDDARLAEEMHNCRLFALPSKCEGFGLVFLEAMAHGRPCLGARAGGIPEVITENTGVLADYGDVAGIAASAVTALRRDWEEATILARARDFSFTPFTSALWLHLNP
jgi:asparagine synthase (glutamine-hydrolysing)